MSYGCLAACQTRSRTSLALVRTLYRKSAEDGSHGNQQCLKTVFWNGLVVRAQTLDVKGDCFTDILYGLFFGATLRYAAWKARNLSDPLSAFPQIDQNLPHVYIVRCREIDTYRTSLRPSPSHPAASAKSSNVRIPGGRLLRISSP